MRCVLIGMIQRKKFLNQKHIYRLMPIMMIIVSFLKTKPIMKRLLGVRIVRKEKRLTENGIMVVCHKLQSYRTLSDFCSYGERKEEK